MNDSKRRGGERPKEDADRGEELLRLVNVQNDRHTLRRPWHWTSMTPYP